MIAIGICTFRGETRLPQTLAHLAAMDRSRISRIIIIDNASDDGTRAVADEHAAAHPGFEVWSAPRPGKNEALSLFFREATEPFLGVVDDDVNVEPGWANAMIARLEASPRAGAVGGIVANEWQGGAPTRLARIYARSLGDQDLGPAPLRLVRPRDFLMGASMAFRREAIIASGWLEHRHLDCRRGERIDSGEDAELCIRIRRAGWEVWYDPAARARHRIPRERQTPRALARLRESIRRSEPWLAWIAGEVTSDEAERQARRARLLYAKNLLTDLRPRRRRVRVAERSGLARGWADLARYLRAREAPGSLPPPGGPRAPTP